MVTNIIDEQMLLVRARTVPTEYILDIVLVATKNSDNFSKSQFRYEAEGDLPLACFTRGCAGFGFLVDGSRVARQQKTGWVCDLQ